MPRALMRPLFLGLIVAGWRKAGGWHRLPAQSWDGRGSRPLGVQTHHGSGDLAHQVAAEVRRFQVQFQGDLAQQIQR